MTVESDSTSPLALLETLTKALTSVKAPLEGSQERFVPHTDGISLLDVKNDLLLSYLQNLVFLILLNLRSVRGKEKDTAEIARQVQQKLVELRVYLEKGVRPVEGRLKYQIDSALRAAQISKQNSDAEEARRTKSAHDLNGARSESELESDEEDEDDAAFEKGEEDDATLLRMNFTMSTKEDVRDRSRDKKPSDRNGVYRPPRVYPTAMPDPDRRDRNNEPRKRRSHLLNEYIDEEMSSAPRAQPSIGSNNTILENGRGGLSRREREQEQERTAYEERNFTRLPNQTKKEKREARRKGQADSRDMFGGEDWTGLGGLGDRVSRNVAGTGRDKTGVLQRREKRRTTEDMPRGDGMGIGDTFDKRRRIVEGRNAKRARRGR